MDDDMDALEVVLYQRYLDGLCDGQCASGPDLDADACAHCGVGAYDWTIPAPRKG